MTTQRLRGPEVRTLLDEFYYMQYGHKPETDEDNMFASIIARPEENIHEYTSVSKIAKEFVVYGIGKTFNISFPEYLQQTIFLRNEMLKIAIERDYYSREQMKDYNKSVKESGKTVSAADLEDLEESLDI